MTEAEWLTSTNAYRLAKFLGPRASHRKLRLYLVALGRRFWHLGREQAGRRALECAERFADGSAGKKELERMYDEIWDQNYAGTPGTYLLWPVSAQLTDCVRGMLDTLPHDLPGKPKWGSEEWKVGMDASGRTRVDYFRDIFGNPVRPAAFAPAWRTSSAAGLAESMHECRDFAAMPVLADALQDAGCEGAAILDHCRGGGVHVRGCWVVDLVLGKA